MKLKRFEEFKQTNESLTPDKIQSFVDAVKSGFGYINQSIVAREASSFLETEITNDELYQIKVELAKEKLLVSNVYSNGEKDYVAPGEVNENTKASDMYYQDTVMIVKDLPQCILHDQHCDKTGEKFTVVGFTESDEYGEQVILQDGNYQRTDGGAEGKTFNAPISHIVRID